VNPATEQEKTAYVMTTRDVIADKITKAFPEGWLIPMPRHGKRYSFKGFDGLVYSRRSCGPMVKAGGFTFLYSLSHEQWLNLETGATVDYDFYRGIGRIKASDIGDVVKAFQLKHPDCKVVSP